MRQIEVDTDVFALIWTNRRHPENSENEILKRVLSNFRADGAAASLQPDPHLEESADCFEEKSSNGAMDGESPMPKPTGKVRWVDDVAFALNELGGTATLHRIYKKVEEVRRQAGRTLPKSLDATIRQTIESHSSDSDNWSDVRKDVFRKVARGEWALRGR